MSARAEAAAIAWRYALAAACIGVAALLQVSPVGQLFHPTGLFILGVVAAAWFGGPGPGVFAAFLSAIALPHLIAITSPLPLDYPLLAGFFDLPRFITLGLSGAAVGWGTNSYRRAAAALRERERELTKARDELGTAVAERTAHLAESEARYARAMEATAAGHWEWDLVTHEVFHSPRFRELYGIPVDEKFADRDAWKARQPLSPSERERQEQALQAAIADPTKPYDIELSFDVRPGEVRWLRSRGKVFRDDQGRPLRISGATSDITAQKLAQQALRQSEERYQRVMLSANAGSWDWDVAKDEFYVSPRLLEMGGFAPGTTFRGREDFVRRAPFHPEDREKWQHAVRELFAGSGSRLAMDVRIIVGGETRWHRLDGMCFRDADGKVVRWTGSSTDATEGKRAEEALRASEQRYAHAMEGSDAGHWDWDLVTDEMFVSERAREMLALPAGAPPATCTEIMALVPMHPDDRASRLASVAASIASGIHERDYRVMPRPGELRWVRSRGKVFRDASGTAVRMTGSLTDITERKLAAEALRLSEQRYARAMDAAEAGHWEWNVATDEMFVSARQREMLELPAELHFGNREAYLAAIPFHPEDRERFRAAAKRHIDEVWPRFEQEFRVVVKGAETRWMRLAGKSHIGTDGKPTHFTGSLIDITEAKLAEQALRASEERYSLAMEASEEGYVDVNVETDEPFISERVNEIIGLPRGTRFATRGEYVAALRFYGNDAEIYHAAIRDAVAKGGEERYECEFRIVVPSGEVRWIWTRGNVVRDAEGRARRRIGVLADITARKVAEEALRRSERRYALAMEAAGDGHTDWNLVSGEFYISPRMLEILGYAPGTTFTDRADWVRRFPFHPEDRPRWEAAVAAHFAGRESKFKMDLRIVVRGETRWVAFTFISTRDASGKPVRWTGSIADITEGKRAEEALRLNEAFLREGQRLAQVGNFAWQVREGDIAWSDEIYRIFEFEAASRVTLERIATRAHPEDRPMMLDMVERARQGVSEFEYEHRLLMPDGRIKHVRLIAHRAWGERDRLEYIGAVQDITGRKVAEEALRLSEERHALAMRASGEGHWDWKIGSDEFYASARYLEIGGFPPDFQYSGRADIVDRIPFHPDDRADYEAAVAAHFAGETPRLDIVVRIVPDGEVRWLHVIGMCLRDADGQPVRWAGSVSDITPRKLAEEARRLSEERYALAMEASDEGHFDWNVRTDEVFASAHMKKLLDLPADVEFRRRDDMVARVRYYPGDRQRLEEMTRRVLGASTLQYEFEYRILRGEEVRWLRARWKIFRDAAGAAQRVIGVLTDITERKKDADALRDSEARFRSLTALSSDWYWRQDQNLRFTSLSADVYDLAGYPWDSSVGKTRWEVAGITPLSTTWEAHRAVLQARQPFRDFEYSRVAPDGHVRYISVSGAPLFDQDGTFLGYEGVGRDITERKRIEAELRSRQEMLEVAQKAARAVPWEWRNGADPESMKWSPEMEAMFGLPPGGYDGTLAAWRKLLHPDDWGRVKSSIAHALATGEIDVEYRVTHADGKVRWLNQKGRTFLDADGRPVRSIGFMFDVTERHKVEDDLRSRQEMLELAQKSARAIAFEWKIGDGEGENRWSSDLEAMYGFAPGTYDGTFETWKKRLHPEDWPAIKEAVRHAQRTGEVASEYRVVHPDGSVHWLQARGRMFFDAAGSPTRMVGFMQDVTQRKQAEDELRKLELELRRAQRLEAMGTLAGGIAHDFNNILGAIVGYGEMALRDAKKGTRLRRDLDAIMAAGERGRSLVDRILAFSRSGVGERVPVHVEEVVREALDQLAAKLPENVTIAPRLHAGRAAMLGDSTQVHQVVMNLANNAVQAMPHGGVLRVALETMRLDTARSATVGAVMPGEYIVLRLNDTGTGISPEVFERMFDPFFTTKEVGVGSGLGLSLVHGIVANVGGAIHVTTELGKGSSFTVYLPRSGEAPTKAIDENRPLPRGDGERVLVVDDEEPLVRLATETLERLGYEAVAFTSSAAALAAFRADPQHFDAVLTDERMPGLSGSALIREMRGIRDSIPVVLMSGYLGATPRDARETGVAEALGILPRVPVGVGADVVVKKPLSARDLAASMARALRH